MTLFIKLENGQPVGNPIVEDNFRQLFPNVSFPKYFTESSVEPFGYGLYDYSSQPEVSGMKKLEEVSPVKNEYGIWKQAWKIVDMFQDYTDDEGVTHTKADQEAAYQADLDAKAREAAIAEINATFEEEIAEIKAGYVEDEIKSWPQQIAEAEAYQADSTAATPMLDEMVKATGATKADLATRITTNAAQYATVFGAALGKKQKAIADLG